MIKKNGFTLIEALIGVTISATVAVGGANYIKDQIEDQKVDTISEKMVKILSGIDQRVYIDKYDQGLWPAVTDYVTTNQVEQFLKSELIATTATCGVLGGWVPTIKDASDVSETTYKNSLRLVPCETWVGTTTEFGMNAQIKINKGINHIKNVTLLLHYNDDPSFEENFLTMKNILRKAKELDTQNITGSHEYRFVDVSATDPLTTSFTSMECLAAKKDCGLASIYSADGVGVEYLDVTGANSMINSKVDFISSVGSSVINNCFTFERDSVTGNWNHRTSVDCGIGIDPTKNHSYVEADVYAASAERINLNKLCKVNISGTDYEVPCGMFKNQNLPTDTDKVIAAFEELQVEDAFVYLLEVSDIYTDNLTVDSELNVGGLSRLNELEVNDAATFNDSVQLNGMNNEISEDLTVNGQTTIDQLTVNSAALFNQNVEVLGYLDVSNGYVSTDYIQLGTITESQINSNCSPEGALKIYKNGTHSETVICSTFEDIDGNSKTAWKLANARVGQIMPFDGSCPDGYEYFEDAAGRFLVGQNETQLSGLSTSQKQSLVTQGKAFTDQNGNVIEYKVGDTGGESFHMLTEAEMPSHFHTVPDIATSATAANYAGYANVYTDGRGSTVWSTADNIPTGPTGGNESHENRPPYYVVNYCIYSGK